MHEQSQNLNFTTNLLLHINRLDFLPIQNLNRDFVPSEHVLRDLHLPERPNPERLPNPIIGKINLRTHNTHAHIVSHHARAHARTPSKRGLRPSLRGLCPRRRGARHPPSRARHRANARERERRNAYLRMPGAIIFIRHRRAGRETNHRRMRPAVAPNAIARRCVDRPRACPRDLASPTGRTMKKHRPRVCPARERRFERVRRAPRAMQCGRARAESATT